MESTAEKLFRLCDAQGKGFIVKEDLLVLQQELSLTRNELENVFENLDSDKMGYLTFPKFVEAYNRYAFNSEGYKYLEIDVFNGRLPGINSIRSKLTNSSGDLAAMDKILRRRNDPILLQCWQALLHSLDKELAENAQRASARTEEFSQLRKDYADLLEQFEMEMEEEKKKILMQVSEEDLVWLNKATERIKHLKIKEDFKLLLFHKEKQIEEMSEYKNELLDRLSLMLRKKNGYKKSKVDLLKEKESLLEIIENQKEIVSQLEEQFDTFRQEMLKECKRRYQEGYEMGRRRAKIEEDRLMEELNILQNVYTFLVDGSEVQELTSEDEKYSHYGS